ncbi:MAG: hypothetical protein ACR2MO_08615 [Acidimicrobiales bacterium]
MGLNPGNFVSLSILARTYYDPAALASPSTVSATLVDVDAANLAVTFTPPPSGVVLVELNALASVTGGISDTYLGWGLRVGAAEVARSHARVLGPLAAQTRMPYLVKFTGLVPAVAVTWKWAHRREAGTGTVFHLTGGEASTSVGPAVMTVYAG